MVQNVNSGVSGIVESGEEGGGGGTVSSLVGVAQKRRDSAACECK